MKNSLQIIALSLSIALLSACQQGTHVIITSDDSGNKTSMEYYGKIAFTEDNTGIKSMAKHSQIKFEQKGIKITAERDMAGITYRVNNGAKTDSLNADQKKIVADIIRKLHKE